MEKSNLNVEGLRRKEIALIHMGKASLALCEDEYRALLAGQASGKTSAKDLTWQERKKVLDQMKVLGFKVIPKRKGLGRNEDQMSKLRKLWHNLTAVGAVAQADDLAGVDAAIEAWGVRMLSNKASSLRFATSAQMQRLIEAMKQWCARVGADVTA